MMKYAKIIEDVIDAFSPGPLGQDELDEFFCDETMPVRTGRKNASPIRDIFEACKKPSEKNTFLLLGHRGCGKSTELNRMAADLAMEGYKVSTIPCFVDLDLISIDFSDILILMGDALAKTAEEIGCDIDAETEEQLRSFWATEIEKQGFAKIKNGLSAKTGSHAGTLSFLSMITSVFARVKADLKYNEIIRTEHRERIANHASDWLSVLRGSIVLEYNADGWYNVHPLILDFLKDQKLVIDFLKEQERGES